MDLKTTYMGLELDSPIIAGASPLTEDLDNAKALEDQGASALVMHSLFEEQITWEQDSAERAREHDLAHAEAGSYFPEPTSFIFGPEAYLEQLRKVKAALSIPVIASLNGVSKSGWAHYAKLMQEAGADAIELNIYHLAMDADEDPRAVEQRYVDVLGAVKSEVSVPVAVKLSPFFSAPAHTAKSLDEAGADALVMFNRFYQPDFDLDKLEVAPVVGLSSSRDLLLRLRWLAATFGRVKCSLAATGGVHTGQDAIKALMAGANAVQMTSAVLRDGPEAIGKVRKELDTWLTEHEYESAAQAIGSLSLQRTAAPAAFERANYMKVLQSWRK